MSLESGNPDAPWDQFAANETMYGVRTTYDESFYTTAIDRSDPQYKQRETEAARIAREIEGSTAASAHVAEERNRDSERGDGLDEEEKYSGVSRGQNALPKRAMGAYVPPSQRPITTAPTVPGAPYDPAIISSSLARSGQKPDVQMPPPAPVADGTFIQPNSTRAPAGTGSATKLTPSSTALATPKKSLDQSAEDLVRNMNTEFRRFANDEKLKVLQVAESKKSAQRHEKNVRINDLKKFAANFKLKSTVPDDLVPILAKDREKQVEIQQKAAEAAKEAQLREQAKTAPPTATTTKSNEAARGTPMEGKATGSNLQKIKASHPAARISMGGSGSMRHGMGKPGTVSRVLEQTKECTSMAY